MDKVRIGFDLGGTNMGAAVVTYDGKILFQEDTPTLSHEPAEKTLGNIKQLIQKCVDFSQKKGMAVHSIGMGCPGLIDTVNGIVRFSPNLPHWKDLNVCQEIENTFNIPVAVDNDVRVATLGEYNFGAGKDYNNILCITIGTGIGGGIILESNLLRGPTQSIGEIGHMTLLKGGPLCGCGNHGCLEALGSATAIIREANEVIARQPESKIKTLLDSGIPMGAYLVSKAAEEGDKEAQRIMKEAGEWIGIGLANVINFLNFEIIIIGGGVSLAGDLIFNPIKETIRERALKIPGEFVKIVPAKLGDEAGMIGASTLLK